MPTIIVRNNDLISRFVDVIVEGQVARSMLEHSQLQPILRDAFGVSDDGYEEIVMEYHKSTKQDH